MNIIKFIVDSIFNDIDDKFLTIIPIICLSGMTFAYNCDLYYTSYFPDVDLGWWLFIVTVGIGGIGIVVGGVVSDKIVAKMGIRSRVAVLAISQLIAAPFAFGSVYFEPLWAMITLGISYFFGKNLPPLITFHASFVD